MGSALVPIPYLQTLPVFSFQIEIERMGENHTWHTCMIGEHGWGSWVTPEIAWSERVVGGATARFAY